MASCIGASWVYQNHRGTLEALMKMTRPGGLVLGTGLAFALSRAARLAWKIRPAEALVAALGGLLLGYGGVVGLGFNIGAFVAGVASGSLHGWIWLIAAFAGTSVGVALRNVGERLRPAG